MSYANAPTRGQKSDEKYREWELQPQTEYRFELAPNTSIGIKVRGPRHALGIHFIGGSVSISSWVAMLSVLEPNSPQEYRTCSGESARLLSIPTVDAHWR